MKKMYISFVIDLRNSEFIDLFSTLHRRLSKVTLNNDLLKERIEKLKHHNKQLILLKPLRANPLTAVINEKVRTRTVNLARLRMKIKSDLISTTPEERIAAERLMYWYDGFKKDLHKPSIAIQNNLVRGLMQERDEEVDIKEATTLLGLNGLLEETLQLTEEITKHDLERLREEVYSSTMIKGIRKEAYRDLKHLVNAIEMYFDEAMEDEKEALIQLNTIVCTELRHMRTKLRSRRTKSKNKREMAAAVEELINTTHKPAPAQNNIPMVNYNELKLFDKRKAPTSNPSQQATAKNATSLNSIDNDDKKDNKFNTKKGLNDSTSIKRDKNKGFDDKLPPIGKN